MIIQMTYGVFSSFRQWLKTPVSIFQILYNDDVLNAAQFINIQIRPGFRDIW